MATEDMQLCLPPFISPLDDTLYERVVNFPDEFPYEFESFTPNHPLDSPVESISSATEAESSSDEEAFFASLTPINNSSPIHFPPPAMDLPEMKKWASAGSPQSVVGGFGDLSGRSSTSSNKSPSGRSHFPSPPTTTCNADISTLDLINEVAGQVARLKINLEATKYAQNNCAVNFLRECKRSCVSSPGKPGRISSLVQPNVTLPPNRIIQQIYSSTTQHQQAPRLQPLQLRSINDFVRQEKLFQANLKQQQEQIRQLERGIEYGVSRAQRTWSSQPTQIPLHCRRLNHPPPFHCPPSSLSSLSFCNVKRESSGTGVFLPRGYGTPPLPRKESVLPPEVVRAISTSNNINNNRVRTQLYGVLSSSNGPLQHETLLPQEWSY